MQINKIKVISGHQKAGEKGVGVVFFELGIELQPMFLLGKGKDSNLRSLWDMTGIRTYVALRL